MRFRGPKALPDNIKGRPFWSRVLSVQLNPSRKDTLYFGEAAGGPRADPELCARCRTASMADGRAHQVSADAQPSAAAESIGGSAGRSTHQVIQPGLRSAWGQRTTHARGYSGRGDQPRDSCGPG